jgi:hypothetical protein
MAEIQGLEIRRPAFGETLPHWRHFPLKRLATHMSKALVCNDFKLDADSHEYRRIRLKLRRPQHTNGRGLLHICNAFVSDSERLYEGNQRIPLFPGKICIGIARALRFTAMPENGFFDRARAAVVQKVRMAADSARETNPPERWRAPFAAVGFSLGAIVCKTFAHVVQEQIGVGPNLLIGEMRLAWHIAGRM